MLKINRLCLIAEPLIKQQGFCLSVAMNSELNIVTDAKATYLTKKFMWVQKCDKFVLWKRDKTIFPTRCLRRATAIFRFSTKCLSLDTNVRPPNFPSTESWNFYCYTSHCYFFPAALFYGWRVAGDREKLNEYFKVKLLSSNSAK